MHLRGLSSKLILTTEQRRRERCHSSNGSWCPRWILTTNELHDNHVVLPCSSGTTTKLAPWSPRYLHLRTTYFIPNGLPPHFLPLSPPLTADHLRARRASPCPGLLREQEEQRKYRGKNLEAYIWRPRPCAWEREI